MLVALGVSGGIAAYKACDMVRGLTKAGADVQVILTPNAARFVSPLTLQTLSRRRVLLDPFDPATDEAIQHIDLVRRASALVVAPATAATLSRLARGLATDLLTSIFVAWTGPVIVAPAMNTRMWLHPSVQANVATLRSRGTELIEPEEGWLAEGETGIGRLAAPEVIVARTLRVARRGTQLSGRRIVFSAGTTREAIDPVRFLSNRSSGRMGYAIAAALVRRGASVVLVSGPVDLAPPWGVELVRVETAAEMLDAILGARIGAHAIVMAAAVSDWVPVASSSKLKKSAGPPSLEFRAGPDILAELGRAKTEEILVGFAAETDDVERNAAAKLREKNADYIVANDVSRPGIGIGGERNAVTILDRAGGREVISERLKGEIAEAILDRIFGSEPA